MKKIMSIIAAVVASAAVADGLASSTIVGYNTATVANGQYKAFAVHFSDLANQNAGIRIDRLFSVSSIKTTAGWGDSMDQIWRWDTTVNKWAKYGYQKPAFGGTAAWKKYDATKTGTAAFSALTDADAIGAEEGFLYYRGNSEPLTLTFKIAED